MTRKKIFIPILLFISTAWCQFAIAASPLMQLSNRGGGFEVVLQSSYNYSKSFEGDNGSGAEIQDTWGWGFGFGYNFDEHWACNFDIGWRSANYDATIVIEDQDDPSNSGPKSFTGRLDTSSSLFSGTYNFLDKRFTPYVSGVLGWTFVDTNIPTGPPQNWCWWDPWHGYICSSYIPTKSETDFTYGGALGLRFDVTRTFFLRASYNKLWIDFQHGSAEDFDVVRLDMGFLMN
jgi:opacity protein-like surface antigen